MSWLTKAMYYRLHIVSHAWIWDMCNNTCYHIRKQFVTLPIHTFLDRSLLSTEVSLRATTPQVLHGGLHNVSVEQTRPTGVLRPRIWCRDKEMPSLRVEATHKFLVTRCVLNGGEGCQECHEVRAWAWGSRWASAIEAGEGHKDERRERRVNNCPRWISWQCFN